MKRRYVLAPEAALDLVKSGATSRRKAARRSQIVFEAAIRDQIVSLAKRPGIGHWRKDLTDEAVKFFPVYSYLIVYRPDTKPLHVVAILQGRRDVRRVLKDRR
jgi:antitoxin ParD1/3/4/toxin ParE1/3/4